jgi:hypothetical protein
LSYASSQASVTIKVEEKMVELMLQCYDRHTGYIVYPVSFSIDGGVVGVNTDGNLVFATVSVGTHEFYAEPPTGYRVICWRIDGPPDISGNPVRLGVLSTSSAVGVYVEKVVVETKLTLEAPSTVRVGETFTVKGVLSRVDTGAGISGQTINVYYDTNLIKSVTTGTDGTYTLSHAIDKTGTFTLKAEFQGTALLGQSSVEHKVGVTTLIGPLGIWRFPLLNILAGFFVEKKSWRR